MNRQNFEAKDRFPLSTQSLAFIQDMIAATAQLSLIGGKNYILDGCQAVGSKINPGIIVVNGEMLPFEGGLRTNTITIVETAESVSANGMTFEAARVTRKAIFASGTGANYYPWADFAPLPTNRQLEQAKATVKYVDDEIAKIQTGSTPKGVIVMWSGSTKQIPTGWALCDGETIDGVKTPDLRGRFVVGYNSSDPDYDTVSVDVNTAKRGGAKTVGLASNQIPAHKHNFQNFFFIEDDTNNTNGADGTIDVDKGTIGPNGWDNSNSRIFYKNWDTRDNTGGGGDHENRPPYYTLAFIMKIK